MIVTKYTFRGTKLIRPIQKEPFPTFKVLKSENPGILLGTIGRDPSVLDINQLGVDIFFGFSSYIVEYSVKSSNLIF